MFFLGLQYLFNAPEGFARLVLEHKVRPSQNLRAAFVTQLAPQTMVPTFFMPLCSGFPPSPVILQHA